MENENLNFASRVPESSPLAVGSGRYRIAPLWHTIMLLVMIVASSLLGSRSALHGHLGQRHVLNYTATLVWEWVLAAFAIWGAWLGGTPLRQLLGMRRAGFEAWVKDIGIAGMFWLIALVVLAMCAALLRATHIAATPQNAAQMAPSTAIQAVLWIVLSVSAGICEEIVFRGYLQQQFMQFTGKLWSGILLSAIFFGTAHGYEGISGMILITLYGGMFSVLAWKRGSLRAGMIAHGWHDAITGLALALLKHLGKI